MNESINLRMEMRDKSKTHKDETQRNRELRRTSFCILERPKILRTNIMTSMNR